MSIKWGLLWWDDKGTLEEKVRRAMTRYQEKHGVVPDTCFVHPGAMNGEKVVVDKCRVVANPTVLLHHYWIGEGV